MTLVKNTGVTVLSDGRTVADNVAGLVPIKPITNTIRVVANDATEAGSRLLSTVVNALKQATENVTGALERVANRLANKGGSNSNHVRKKLQ